MDKINLTNDDVVSVSGEVNLTEGSTSTGQELMDLVGEWIYDRSNIGQDNATCWVDEGVECKVLLAVGVRGWQKGKVRLRLEFIPDNPISPLDDLRNSL